MPMIPNDDTTAVRMNAAANNQSSRIELRLPLTPDQCASIEDERIWILDNGDYPLFAVEGVPNGGPTAMELARYVCEAINGYWGNP